MAPRKEYWLLNPPRKKRRKVRRKRPRKNPALALYGNPRKKGSHMAKRKRKTRRRAFRRRARVHANPPRRRRRRAGFMRRRTARRRYRRNPGFGSGIKVLGFNFPPIKRVAGGMVGLAAARALPGYAKRYLPIPPGAAVDLALGAISGMVAGIVAGKFMGKQFGEDVAFGAIIGVADDAARMYLYPAVGLSAYLEPGLSAYLQPGMSQYLSPGATIPALGDVNYGFEEDGDFGSVDLPSRLNPGSRL